MKRIIPILFLAILSIAVFAVLRGRSGTTVKKSESDFAIEDTVEVGRILIGDMKGNQNIIERKGNFWVVNQMYPVRNDYMKVLLQTIHRVAMNYPVSNSAKTVVMKQLSSENKKVEIYDREGKLMKAYFVGGPSLDSKGNYFLMEDSNSPMVAHIPGFSGVLDTRFETRPEEIRSRSIYSFQPNEITSIGLQYERQPEKSFTIEIITEDSFLLKNSTGTAVPAALQNKERITGYVSEYDFVNCEAFENSNPAKDSILTTIPYCRITVTDSKGMKHETIIYYRPIDQTTENFDQEGNLLAHDVDRYYATINNGADFILIQQFHFGRLFRELSYFLKQAV
jgi:hypothetical protein